MAPPEAPAPKPGLFRVCSFTLSADGFGAGIDQAKDQPMGRGTASLRSWDMATRTSQQLLG